MVEDFHWFVSIMRNVPVMKVSDDPDYVRETGHPAYRADDALWLFPTVYKYIAETGQLDFIDEEIMV